MAHNVVIERVDLHWEQVRRFGEIGYRAVFTGATAAITIQVGDGIDLSGQAELRPDEAVALQVMLAGVENRIAEEWSTREGVAHGH